MVADGLERAPRVTRLGVRELPECGTNDEVLAYHRLDVPSLVEAFRGVLEGTAPSRSGQHSRATQLT